MQIAICDDEKEMRAMLAEKVQKIYPEAVLKIYQSGEGKQQLCRKFKAGYRKRTFGNDEKESGQSWIWPIQYTKDSGEIFWRYRFCHKK